MDLDENLKRLTKELGDAINEAVADSERIADVISRIRNSGFDPYLVLEVTIGLIKIGEVNMMHRRKLNGDAGLDPDFHLTTQDTQFLRALKIVVDKNFEE